MDLSLQVLTLLFFVAMLAGCVDAIAGGGGLIVIPTMLSLGFPPAAALATNKLQASGGALAATLVFLRRGMIDIRHIYPVVLACFLGAGTGGWLLLRIDNSILKSAIPVLLILIAVYVLLAPGIGKLDAQPKISLKSFSIWAAPLLGFYDGFFGPGTGSFMAIACVSLLGFNLTKATAHAKLLNFTSNIAALLYFITFGKVYWTAGLVMLAGQLMGGYAGARLVLKSGQRLIRITIVIVSTAMCIKLIMS